MASAQGLQLYIYEPESKSPNWLCQDQDYRWPFPMVILYLILNPMF